VRDVLWNALLLVADGLILWRLARKPGARATAGILWLGPFAALGAAALGEDSFGVFRLLAWAVFVHAPLTLSGSAVALRRATPRLAIAGAVVGAIIIIIGIDAFLVEPDQLEVARVELRSSALAKPLRIGVAADIQIDREPGEHERAALGALAAAKPDLVLLAGDFVQQDDLERARRVRAALGACFREARLEPPLGVHVARGNIDDDDGWEEPFAGLPWKVYRRSESIAARPDVALTGLAVEDSFRSTIRVKRAAPGFHVVFGHAPDFALGDIDADLLVAGHTHGGQVRLPLLGPILTLSRVPRSWAAGVTVLGPRTLVVTRGVGLERGHAPRLRFLCRPEVVIIDVAVGPS
jgi:predicted MPP superfamily phosphohydrolase